jgi:Fe-Mn family superoxide dismutase
MIYSVRNFDLSGLHGISDATLETHFKLYEGYVKHTNAILEKTSELASQGQPQARDKLAYSELKRRLGFEYNGMVLHELYFDNMKKNGGIEPTPNSPFLQQVAQQWGSYDAWRKEFAGVGEMRGVGWAICYQDPHHGALVNEWITLHETGHIAGYRPILVMDVWEHAFILDYKPSERARYIDAFFSNVNWKVVESRLASVAPPSAAGHVRSAL